MKNPNGDVTNQDEELASFVKLSVMYMGIMAGMAVIGLVLFLVASRGEAPGSIPITSESWSISISILVSLIIIPLVSLAMLVRRMRVGAYLAFSALVISLFAPGPSQTVGQPFTIIYWLAIPNAVVGILLLKDLKKLH